MYFRPISLQSEVEAEPHAEDTDGSVDLAEGPWKGIATHLSTEVQTFAFVKIDLGSCYLLVLTNHLHSLYIQVAGYKDCDIIGERGSPYRKGLIFPLIPNLTDVVWNR